MDTQPIKRHRTLQPLSREHHYGLLFCWKLRTGFKKQIEPERLKKYADWFYGNHLLSHFTIEEKYIFPVLGSEHKLIKRALKEHRRLKRLFSSSEEILKNLILIEEELENHIRFEERILFNEVQKSATDEQLQQIQLSNAADCFVDNFSDPFWEK